MQKRGDLLPYAILSLLMGGVILIMFLRLGTIFGDSSARIDDYMVKDTALFLTALHSVPGNLVINFFYPVHDKFVRITKSKVSIIEMEDDILTEHFSYRTVGYSKTGETFLNNDDFFEITKSGNSININEIKRLDALSCHVSADEHSISSLQFFYTDFQGERRLIESIISGIRSWFQSSGTNRFNIISNVDNILSSSQVFPVDQAIIFSASKTQNNFVAYVHHENILGRTIACEFLNLIINNQNIDSDNFMVYSIDPDFYEINNIALNKNMIYLELGSLENIEAHSVRMQNKIITVLEEFK